MKKLLGILIVTFVIVTGCGNKASTSFSFELKGNPTTGYEWTCEIADDKIASASLEYKTDNENLQGSGGAYTVTLKPLEKGETTLTCTYKRSWEETESDTVKEYKVTVDKDKKIEVEEK